MEVRWDQYWGITNHTFDNIYSYLMVNYGVVWICILAVMFVLVAKKGEEKDKILVFLWALYGTTEVHVLNPYLFFPIVLAAKHNLSQKSIRPSKETKES